MTTRSLTPRATKAQLADENYQLEQSLELMQERFAELELAIEDRGWVRMSTESQQEFSREGLRRIMMLATMAYLKNPLINHATEVQAHYVWGQGVNIHCPDQAIDKVVQTFLKDRRNKKVLTGHQAQHEKEVELQTKANLFLVLFTNDSTGNVQVRSFPAEECEDIIRNPDDSAEAWYYVRRYDRLKFNPATGKIETLKGVREFYPDWLYEPDSKPASFDGDIVHWDQPVYHVAVGRLGAMRFGIPEHYSALDWAQAVKNDLEDYATIKRALARFAFKLTAPSGPKAVQNAKTKLGTTLGANNARETNPAPNVGSMWLQSIGDLQPIKTAGAQPSPEEGRRLTLMVSSGTGIPETMLTGDSSSGNYASARTLDRPTELKMRTRQELWADVYRDILTYVVRKAKLSVSNELSSLPQVVEAAIKEATAIVNLGGKQPADADAELEQEEVEINVDFPAVLEHDVLPRVQAIVQAATLNGGQTAGTMSDRTLIRLLLRAMNVDNADALLDEILPDGAEYFDTEGAEAQKAAEVTSGGGGGGPDASKPPTATKPPVPVKEAAPPVPPVVVPPPPTPPAPNPNVDESGIGMDKSGLHKVAPPPPSMRNQKTSGPNPFDPANAAPGATGKFESDVNSQRPKGATPPRGKS